MNKITPVLLVVILIVVTINLLLTFALVSQQQTDSAEQRISSSVARDWRARVTGLYNRQDYVALHGLFSERARQKITTAQLQGQLQKLHQLFGDIGDYDYLNSIKVGEKGGEQYHQLFFNLRVGTAARRATMKLSLVLENQDINLYGMTINASQSLD